MSDMANADKIRLSPNALRLARWLWSGKSGSKLVLRDVLDVASVSSVDRALRQVKDAGIIISKRSAGLAQDQRHHLVFSIDRDDVRHDQIAVDLLSR